MLLFAKFKNCNKNKLSSDGIEVNPRPPTSKTLALRGIGSNVLITTPLGGDNA